MKYTLAEKENRLRFRKGMIDSLPIGLGYLAVSFSLGIAAKNAGLTPFQAALASFFCNASAGEYSGFTLISAGATYLEVALITLIANARYLLMSCAMSQRLDGKMPFWHRYIMAYDITDELFGIAIAQQGYLNPFYTYGAMLVALPSWAIGTALGAFAGSVLPLQIVSAFSVALYGMFIAIIVPASKKNRILAGIILFCFLASYCAANLPWISDVPEGTRTIILTVVIASAAALLFPRPVPEENDSKEEE